MGREKHGPATVCDLFEQMKDFGGLLAIHCAGGLVGQEEGLTPGNGPCDPHTLSLPTREFPRVPVLQPFQADLRQGSASLSGWVQRTQSSGSKDQFYILAGSKVRNEIGLLEHGSDARQTKVIASPSIQLLQAYAGDMHNAAVGGVEPAE